MRQRLKKGVRETEVRKGYQRDGGKIGGSGRRRLEMGVRKIVVREGRGSGRWTFEMGDLTCSQEHPDRGVYVSDISLHPVLNTQVGIEP